MSARRANPMESLVFRFVEDLAGAGEMDALGELVDSTVREEHSRALHDALRTQAPPPELVIIAGELLEFDRIRAREFLNVLHTDLRANSAASGAAPGWAATTTRELSRLIFVRQCARENLRLWLRDPTGELPVKRMLSTRRGECEQCIVLATGPWAPLRDALPLGHCACGGTCDCAIAPKLDIDPEDYQLMPSTRYALKRMAHELPRRTRAGSAN